MFKFKYILYKNIILLILYSLLSFYPLISFSFGRTEHRVIAHIAMHYISDNTKKELNYILQGMDLVNISNFVDEHKYSKGKFKWQNCTNQCDDIDVLWKDTPHWHSISFRENEKIDDSDKMISAIKTGIEILKNKNASTSLKLNAIIWLTHLIGEIHQPLHTLNEDQNIDSFGYLIDVRWRGKKTNLHTMWDREMIAFSQFSYSELGDNLMQPQLYVDDQDIKIKDNNTDILLNSNDGYMDWILESRELAKHIYNTLPKNHKLSSVYYFKNYNIICTQLLKAGIRLAKVLNNIN
ncbi:MAG: S1/P1 nuclease [Anaplasmataceae bacterium]|nr:S1/P1 nuclease [Anaplasmataceae bacterium]